MCTHTAEAARWARPAQHSIGACVTHGHLPNCVSCFIELKALVCRHQETTSKGLHMKLTCPGTETDLVQ